MTPGSRYPIPSILALALAAALTAPVTALAENGQFLAISDVHLNPLTGAVPLTDLLSTDAGDWPGLFARHPEPVVTYGADANVPLFQSAIADAAARVPSPDFVLYTGDFIVHELATKVTAADADAPADAVSTMAAKITRTVGQALKAAFPSAPIFPALGNTDSACGDYQVEPEGAYLTATWPMVEELVGADRLQSDAAATWRAGGYYAARHPTVENALIVVFNNVLWSTKYENRCGTADGDPGTAMMGWLKKTLYEARLTGKTVWLVHHVPAGVNAYSTAHARPSDGGTCAADTMPFWKQTYIEGFASLMDTDAGTVTAAFSGHIHRDSFRLSAGSEGAPIGFASIVPAISPIFGNNPGYQVFDYDRKTGTLSDKTTFGLANLAAAAKQGANPTWREEGRFSTAYGLGPYDRSSLTVLSAALSAPERGGKRTTYAHLYGVGHGNDPATEWPVYGCSPGHVPIADFNACRCAEGAGRQSK
ncbi:MAG: hypothetical protein GY798_15405 [Hyphomicrobiales bacterium]|nr:hypothetical protein [Hyphomicrobiales bacterium]